MYCSFVGLECFITFRVPMITTIKCTSQRQQNGLVSQIVPGWKNRLKEPISAHFTALSQALANICTYIKRPFRVLTLLSTPSVWIKLIFRSSESLLYTSFWLWTFVHNFNAGLVRHDCISFLKGRPKFESRLGIPWSCCPLSLQAKKKMANIDIWMNVQYELYERK
jgi:hypothetical protein